MKAKTTFLFFLFITSLTFGQNYDLLKDKTETKILYDRVFGISNAVQTKKEGITAAYFKQVYHEIQRADFLERLPKLELLKEEALLGFAKKQVPLSLLVTDFETIKQTSLDQQDVFLNTNHQMDVKPDKSPFEKHHLCLIAPLVSKTNEAHVEFILKDNLVFNTTNQTVASISMHFNDGKELKNICINKPIKVHFSKSGKQIIHFAIKFNNGETRYQTAEIDVVFEDNGNKNPNDVNTIMNINATIPYQGYDETAAFLGQGEYEIFLDNVNGVLDKPVFLVDGFDPGDARNISSIYSLLNYGTGQNLADVLRAQGFDLVLLNFPTYTRPNTTTVVDGGGDYIQRNAMVLVSLINQINAQKTGTEKNVLIGPSMGGLISRYALRYMETNSLNPDTRLFLSFDAPHLGANFPIGMQHLLNYMGYGPLGDTSIQALVDGLLKSPSAKEMLLDHFEGHLQSGSAFEFNTSVVLPTGTPNFRDAFQTELNAMGFPTTSRNIAIANGSSNGTQTGSPDMLLMDHTFNITATQRAIINLRFTPMQNTQNQVSRFRAQGQLFGFWITAYESLANSKAPLFTGGLDSAPGGKFDINAFAGMAGTNPLLSEFFNNLLLNYFDFVPTNSALAVSNTSNWYAPITGSSVTPFVASSVPTVNENHVTLTTANVAFALNEILNPVLSLDTNAVFEAVTVQNPVGNNVEIFSSKPISNATVAIVAINGKVVFSKTNQTIEGSYQIPVTIAKGMYLLRISNNEGKTNKKLLKN